MKKILFLCLTVWCFNLAYAAIEILRETKDGIDCKTNMVQQLAITLFPENMGNGTAVFTEQKAGTMVPVKAGSIEAAVMQKVCR